MFPFIDPVLVRLDNQGDRPVKIGYKVITAGSSADVPVGTLHAPALRSARDSGVVFVGLVVNGVLHDLVPAEEEVVEEEVVEEEEEVEEEEVEEEEDYSSMYKSELVAVAEELGYDVDGMLKAEILELLEGD